MCIFFLSSFSLSSFGKGGDEQRLYGLCVLPLNIVNQKFYTIFWFWLSFLQVSLIHGNKEIEKQMLNKCFGFKDTLVLLVRTV